MMTATQDKLSNICKIKSRALEMRIAVVGNRKFQDFNLLKTTLEDYIVENCFDDVTIVSGGSLGADKLAEKYAIENQYNLVIFQPDWRQYGRSAGIIRNKLIVDNSDIVFAFWNEDSRGTRSTIKFAKKAKKPYQIISYPEILKQNI